MKSDYTSNYIKNSLFQILATGIGFLSLFIVVPFLSENKVLYGIYSVCISLSIFFNYADFGFLTACQKYTGEFYAQNDIKEEIRTVGFTSFVLIFFVLIIGVCLLPIAISPHVLINDIKTEDEVVATILILSLILSAPFIAIKRICNVIYSCRIEQYKYQMYTLVGHLIKLMSVLVFFTGNRYMLVEYFIFIQIVDVLITVLLVMYIFRHYDYNYELFLLSFRFDKRIWLLVRDLVGASIFTTISWILYYEMDLMVLAKISTPENLALYSAAFTFLTLVRNYFSVIYSSFSPRYNHYVGLNDSSALRNFYIKNIVVLLPIVLFPLIIFIIAGYPLIISWVGKGYEETVLIAKVLVAGNILAFLSYPSTQYIIATNRIKDLILSSALMPFVFYGGIVCTFSFLGILSFALFKSVAQILSAIYRGTVCLINMEINFSGLLIKITKDYILPIFLLIILSFLIINYMVAVKAAVNLIYNLVLSGVVFGVIIGITLLSSYDFRSYMLTIYNRIKK